jgi:DNA-binding HxlR family transcriptional regulator
MKNFDHQQLDDIIHSRIRLAIMAILVSVEDAEFTYLRDKVNTSDGNLNLHLKKLEEAKYISVKKLFVARKPVTQYKITALGRKAFEIYVDRLEHLIKR